YRDKAGLSGDIGNRDSALEPDVFCGNTASMSDDKPSVRTLRQSVADHGQFPSLGRRDYELSRLVSPYNVAYVGFERGTRSCNRLSKSLHGIKCSKQRLCLLYRRIVPLDVFLLLIEQLSLIDCCNSRISSG